MNLSYLTTRRPSFFQIKSCCPVLSGYVAAETLGYFTKDWVASHQRRMTIKTCKLRWFFDLLRILTINQCAAFQRRELHVGLSQVYHLARERELGTERRDNDRQCLLYGWHSCILLM